MRKFIGCAIFHRVLLRLLKKRGDDCICIVNVVVVSCHMWLGGQRVFYAMICFSRKISRFLPYLDFFCVDPGGFCEDRAR